MTAAEIHTAFGHDEVFWLALTAIGALLLPVVTLGGFLFVSKQLKSEREALETQTREQVYLAGLQVLQIFIDHPELRSYFYDGTALPVEVAMVPGAALPPALITRNKVLAACEVMADHWENILLSREALDRETLAIWKSYMTGIYATSPSMRTFLLEEGYRYARAFLELLDSKLPGACIEKRQSRLAAFKSLSERTPVPAP